jgi:hypothetical protein
MSDDEQSYSEEQPVSQEPQQSNFDFAKDKLDNTVEWITEIYSRHPKENGMTAMQHLGFALKLSGMTMLSGLLLFVHAVSPWWFTTTGGDLLLYAGETLKNSRHTSNTKDDEQKEPESTNLEPITMDELPQGNYVEELMDK